MEGALVYAGEELTTLRSDVHGRVTLPADWGETGVHIWAKNHQPLTLDRSAADSVVQLAFEASRLPSDGVGLARLEFIIGNTIKVHLRRLVEQAVDRPEKGCQCLAGSGGSGHEDQPPRLVAQAGDDGGQAEIVEAADLPGDRAEGAGDGTVHSRPWAPSQTRSSASAPFFAVRSTATKISCERPKLNASRPLSGAGAPSSVAEELAPSSASSSSSAWPARRCSCWPDCSRSKTAARRRCAARWPRSAGRPLATSAEIVIFSGFVYDPALAIETATSHSVTVRATSDDGSTVTRVFTISVTDVNESPVGSVTDDDGAANTVAEALSYLGEKLITGKNSLWDRSTRVPLIFAGPALALALRRGHRMGGA